jgi:23S rRNA (guanosine2251-2'-O)-methyltransferase
MTAITPELILIVHNVRSCYNVGSILRTADGLGVTRVYLTGYSPYPLQQHDTRLPHIAQKIDKQIQKTALGAEASQDWQQGSDVLAVIASLKHRGILVAALEQSAASYNLPDYRNRPSVAILIGREVEGVEADILAACDVVLEIPMLGSKESFNVAQAAAMALYHLRFIA